LLIYLTPSIPLSSKERGRDLREGLRPSLTYTPLPLINVNEGREQGG